MSKFTLPLFIALPLLIAGCGRGYESPWKTVGDYRYKYRECLNGEVAGPGLESPAGENQTASLDQILERENGPGIIGGATLNSGGPLAKSVVFLRRKSATETNYCSGTLISGNFVLTAAHCLNPPKAEPGPYTIEAVFAVDPLCSSFQTGQNLVRLATTLKYAEQYDADDKLPYEEDIALVRLNARAPAHALPLPVAALEVDISSKENVFVAGFGINSDRGVENDEWQPRLKVAAFNPTGSHPFKFLMDGLRPKTIAVPVGQDTYICDGDSGSGISTYVDGHLSLIGVITHAGVDQPGITCKGAFVYQNIEAYREWLIDTYDHMKEAGDDANPFVASPSLKTAEKSWPKQDGKVVTPFDRFLETLPKDEEPQTWWSNWWPF